MEYILSVEHSVVDPDPCKFLELQDPDSDPSIIKQKRKEKP
jgi:hypothetical protein